MKSLKSTHKKHESLKHPKLSQACWWCLRQCHLLVDTGTMEKMFWWFYRMVRPRPAGKLPKSCHNLACKFSTNEGRVSEASANRRAGNVAVRMEESRHFARQISCSVWNKTFYKNFAQLIPVIIIFMQIMDPFPKNKISILP